VLAAGVRRGHRRRRRLQDRTVERAAAAGARGRGRARRGYGRAMMAGIAAASPDSTIVLFIDGDGSDRPR
jgi:glycosyltransferase involved in cell wall biosynthesis